MEEVISEAEETNVDRHVEIGGSGAGFGVFGGDVALGHEDLLQ
jgi:ABC-type phosphate transport system substrate-binding protein